MPKRQSSLSFLASSLINSDCLAMPAVARAVLQSGVVRSVKGFLVSRRSVMRQPSIQPTSCPTFTTGRKNQSCHSVTQFTRLYEWLVVNHPVFEENTSKWAEWHERMRNEIRPIPLPFPRFLHSGREGTGLVLPGAEIGLGLFSKATNLANARATPPPGPFPASPAQ